MDRVVDDYEPVVEGLENGIDEIEAEVFGGNPNVSRRTYQLSRAVIEFQRATRPLAGILERLLNGEEGRDTDPEVRRYLREVQDHALRVIERVDVFRELLSNILSVNLTVVSLAQNEEVKNLTEANIDQNEEVKKISAWATILFAPTLVGTVYGMNFDNMPELPWVFGYPFALLLMAMISLTLYLIFKRRGWL
jgi:magnesium transporter